MNEKEKKMLYESIMERISKQVKKRLFRKKTIPAKIAAAVPYCEAIDELLTDIVNKAKERLKTVPTKELNNMFSVVYEHMKLPERAVPVFESNNPDDDKPHPETGFSNADYRYLYSHNIHINHSKMESVDLFQWPTSIERLKEKFKARHNLKDWNFERVDADDFGSDNINFWSYYDLLGLSVKDIETMIIPNVDENVAIVEEELQHHGYEILRIGMMEAFVPKFNKNMTCAIVVFTAMKPKDIRKIIEKFRVLYHLSIHENCDSILKYGIKKQKRQGEMGIFYGERVFFFCGQFKKNAIEYAQEIAVSYGQPVDLFTVNLSKLPDDWTFHFDPLIGKTAVYTEHDIPADAIVSVEEL